MTTATMATGTRTAESELRAAARRRGLTMKELAAMMGVSAGYLSQFANGRRPWTPKMREKVAAVLGEVPGQGIVYRQGGVVSGESSFIRERARTLGMTMQDLAERTGVSYSYMTQVARGRKHMGVKVQARVETAVDIRPRQFRLLLEPHQPLREVCGEVGCSSAVVDALSRHGAGPPGGLSRPLLLRARPGRAAPTSGVRPVLQDGRVPAPPMPLAHVCLPFCCPKVGVGLPCAQPPDSSWPLCQPEPKVIPSWLSTQTRTSSEVTQLPSAVTLKASVPSTSSRLFPTMSLR